MTLDEILSDLYLRLHTAAVDHAYHWQPMTSCPKGSKVPSAPATGR